MNLPLWHEGNFIWKTKAVMNVPQTSSFVLHGMLHTIIRIVNQLKPMQLLTHYH